MSQSYDEQPEARPRAVTLPRLPSSLRSTRPSPRWRRPRSRTPSPPRRPTRPTWPTPPTWRTASPRSTPRWPPPTSPPPAVRTPSPPRRGRSRPPSRARPLPRTRSRSSAAPVVQAGRLVRGPHLLRHGEPGEGQPREPDHLPQHGGLHPRGDRPDRGGRGDQERSAQAGPSYGPPRLRPGPHGPDRRVLVRGPAHPVRDRLRRAQPPAGAAEPRPRSRACSPRPSWPRSRRRRPSRPAPPRPRRRRSRSPTSTSPTRSWSSTDRSPRSTRRSPRSTRTPRGSRPSSRSSAGRPRSSCSFSQIQKV